MVFIQRFCNVVFLSFFERFFGLMGPGPMGPRAHGPPNEKFKLSFPEAFLAFSGNEKCQLSFPDPFLTCPETTSVNCLFRCHFWHVLDFWHPSMVSWGPEGPPSGQIFEKWRPLADVDNFFWFLTLQIWDGGGSGLRRVRILKNDDLFLILMILVSCWSHQVGNGGGSGLRRIRFLYKMSPYRLLNDF